MNIITDILAHKVKEVGSMPLMERHIRTRVSFVGACAEVSGSCPFFIAEIKPHSPSAGPLCAVTDLDAIIPLYDRYAQAISVLCDQKFFHGGFDLLSHVASCTEKPLLAKDFFISVQQIYRAAQAGASAILLIPGILELDQAIELMREALACELDILLEFHGADDVNEDFVAFYHSLSDSQKAKVLVGVNNRDLRDLTLDLATTKKLMPLLRNIFGNERLFVSESGITQVGQVEDLQAYADGFLIGTGLLQNERREDFFIHFLSYEN